MHLQNLQAFNGFDSEKLPQECAHLSCLWNRNDRTDQQTKGLRDQREEEDGEECLEELLRRVLRASHEIGNQDKDRRQRAVDWQICRHKQHSSSMKYRWSEVMPTGIQGQSWQERLMHCRNVSMGDQQCKSM